MSTNIWNANAWSKRLLAAPLLAMTMAAWLAGCGSGGSSPADNAKGMAGAPTTPTAITSKYAVTNLTSDGGVTASNTDANLKNGWGIAFNPNGFAWVADNGTSRSTIYDGNGVLQQPVVTIPDGQTGSASPTGIVYSGGTGFVVTQNGQTGPSRFIFAGEGGTISGWSPTVNLSQAITMFDGGSAEKVYKGLAIADSNNATYLYAADFHNGTIDIFDGKFNRVTLAGNFTDPALPAGYGPFGIHAINGQIYVSYAQQDASAHDDVKGAGFGFINVFDTSGTLVKRLVSNGALNAPWGMAMAPASFGQFSNTLLVGNFGDGRINAFDPSSGNMIGTLSGADGNPIMIDGLWGIAFGNGQSGFPANSLFFAAGPNDEANGLFGRIDMQ